MISVTTDKEVFKVFHKDEKENSPAWFNAAASSWARTEEEFLEFCYHCAKVYLIDDVALLYVENVEGNANIHFSLLRGSKVEIEDLIAIKEELAKEYKMIFGWCSSKNWGLKKILESCGLYWNGIIMLKGWYLRPLEWRMFSTNVSNV